MWLTNACANRRQRDRERRAYLWRREHLQQEAVTKLLRAAVVIRNEKQAEATRVQKENASKTWDRVARIARHWRVWASRRANRRRDMMSISKNTSESEIEEEKAESRGLAAERWSRLAMEKSHHRMDNLMFDRRRGHLTRLNPKRLESDVPMLDDSRNVFDEVWSPSSPPSAIVEHFNDKENLVVRKQKSPLMIPSSMLKVHRVYAVNAEIRLLGEHLRGYAEEKRQLVHCRKRVLELTEEAQKLSELVKLGEENGPISQRYRVVLCELRRLEQSAKAMETKREMDRPKIRELTERVKLLRNVLVSDDDNNIDK